MSNVVRKGTVKEYDLSDRSGSIIPDDGSEIVLVDLSSIIKSAGFCSLAAGESVEYVLEHDDKGPPKASNVTGPDGANVKGITLGGRGLVSPNYPGSGCSVCGEFSHDAWDCSLRDYGCDNCGAIGHDTTDCMFEHPFQHPGGGGAGKP